MARPAKSANVTAKHLTKAEKDAKLAAESQVKGNADKIRAPSYLSRTQKKIFKNIVNELKASSILGNLDVYVLAEASIAIDRMQDIETMINEKPELITNINIMSAKDKYTKAFFRYCNELCLSPQSRAKMANINMQAKKDEENPLLKALMEDD